jgi:outer membrane protein
VKKPILLGAVVAILAGAAFSQPVQAQNQPAAAAPELPHKVGLIDMAFVFNEYEKFTALKAELQAAITASDNEARAMIEQLQVIQQQLTGGTLAEDSADYARLEADFLRQQTELETYRQVQQRQFLKREAEIYKTVYLDVEHAVSMFATHYQYTLIMRFNRAEVDSAENPQEIIQSLNRQVVYYRQGDDITDQILGYLNSEYRRQAGTAATPAATQPAAQGNTPRPPQ